MMEANRILLQKKYARVIEEFAGRIHVPRMNALDLFYHSYTYQEMNAGISDMHCRSDGYLAEELDMEYNGNEYNGKERIKN